MIPKTRIKFLVIFLFLAHGVGLGKLVSELQWIFFSGHFREEGGRFIRQKSLKQVFSAPSLSGILWVFWVVPTVFIWVFMWILIISCKKSAYFTFGARILHWKLLKISVQIPYPKNFEQLPVQYAGTKREICRLFTTDYQNSHKNSYENSWYNSENSEEPTQRWCWKYLF